MVTGLVGAVSTVRCGTMLILFWLDAFESSSHIYKNKSIRNFPFWPELSRPIWGFQILSPICIHLRAVWIIYLQSKGVVDVRLR